MLVSYRDIYMKQKKLFSSEWQDIKAIIIIILFYFFMSMIFDIGCPILWITGISCAGCGMTRAWISLLHLDFKAAFHYHPLFWLPAIMVVVYFLKNKLPKRVLSILSAGAIFLFLLIYILRMSDTSDSIVIFQPWDGIIGKVISQLLNK